MKKKEENTNDKFAEKIIREGEETLDRITKELLEDDDMMYGIIQNLRADLDDED